jgi:hypothetical protein
MNPIQLLQARAALGGAIGMTLQEWRELMDAIWADTETDWTEVEMARTYLGKPILITVERA